MNQNMTSITTPRLLLRPIVDADVECIHQGLSDPRVIQHYGVSYDSVEATQAQMRWFAAEQQCWWAICGRDSKEFYGAAGFNDWSREHQKAEIGLWLLPDHWGQGFMKEAMDAICEFGFHQMGLHRIEGFVDASNQNCKRAMAKLDFEHEGTMRDCEVKDESYVSVEIYAKLKQKS